MSVIYFRLIWIELNNKCFDCNDTEFIILLLTALIEYAPKQSHEIPQITKQYILTHYIHVKQVLNH